MRDLKEISAEPERPVLIENIELLSNYINELWNVRKNAHYISNQPIDIIPTLDRTCALRQRKCDEKIFRHQQTSEWGF